MGFQSLKINKQKIPFSLQVNLWLIKKVRQISKFETPEGVIFLLLKKFNGIYFRKSQKYFVGTSWTIDAQYRETITEATQYQKEGMAMVEMGVRHYLLLPNIEMLNRGHITISDSLAELKWKPKFHLKKIKGLEIFYKVAVDVLLNY